MRLTLHLPDGDLSIEFTPRQPETETPEYAPQVDVKHAASLEIAHQDDGPVHVLGFQPGGRP